MKCLCGKPVADTVKTEWGRVLHLCRDCAYDAVNNEGATHVSLYNPTRLKVVPRTADDLGVGERQDHD